MQFLRAGPAAPAEQFWKSRALNRTSLIQVIYEGLYVRFDFTGRHSGRGVSFSVNDKLMNARKLDALGNEGCLRRGALLRRLEREPNARCKPSRAAKASGADVLCVCDTNGGTLPRHGQELVTELRRRVRRSHRGPHPQPCVITKPSWGRVHLLIITPDRVQSPVARCAKPGNGLNPSPLTTIL